MVSLVPLQWSQLHQSSGFCLVVSCNHDFSLFSQDGQQAANLLANRSLYSSPFITGRFITEYKDLEAFCWRRCREENMRFFWMTGQFNMTMFLTLTTIHGMVMSGEVYKEGPNTQPWGTPVFTVRAEIQLCKLLGSKSDCRGIYWHWAK